MPELFESLLSAAIFFLAGFFTFFVIFDRLILQMEQGKFKTAITYSLMAFFFIIPAAFGWSSGISFAALIPAIILTIYIIGELLRHMFRRRYAGSSPLSETSANFDSSSVITTTSVMIRKYQVRVSRWKAGRLRIVHLTDLHVDDDLPADYHKFCMQQTMNLDPSMIVMTGDFVNIASYASRLSEILSDLRAPLGVYAVLGNHDYWAGRDVVEKALTDAGVTLVGGNCLTIDTHSGGVLQICGTEAPWGRHLHPRIPSIEDNHLTIILSHTPDNVFLMNKENADLVFAGHFHGGQWRVPGLGPLVVPSRRGRLLDHGHFCINETNLFISSGLGTAWFPMRLLCEPEILVVDVNPA
jgi:predicted MPP superfamily phosphohydrolase